MGYEGGFSRATWVRCKVVKRRVGIKRERRRRDEAGEKWWEEGGG
jgi:hypothetical protein